MVLGEMEVFGTPPAKFIKALATIAAYLHDSFDEESWIKPEWSRRSCVLSSLAVRDFLWQIGFKDAAVASVLLMIRAYEGDKETHSLGIGVTDEPNTPTEIPGHWNGHLVVRVPSVGYIIDTTLYQALRPQWEGMFPMMAVPTETRDIGRIRGMTPLACLETATDAETVVAAAWLHNPANKGWRGPGDNDTNKSRRATVIKKLVQRFGRWEE